MTRYNPKFNVLTASLEDVCMDEDLLANIFTGLESFNAFTCSMENIENNDGTLEDVITVNRSVNVLADISGDDSIRPPAELGLTEINETALEPSMEGIVNWMQSIYDTLENIYLAANRLAIGFVKNMTDGINKTRDKLNGCRKLLDEKEFDKDSVKGAFVNQLSVTSGAANVKTILATTELSRKIASEMLGTKQTEKLVTMSSAMTDAILSDLKKEDVNNPSKWWVVLTILLFNYMPLTGPLSLPISYAIPRFITKKLFNEQTVVRDLKKVYGDQIPDLFAMYPTLAANNADKVSEDVETKRSDYLFNEKVITVSRPDVNKIVKTENQVTMPQSFLGSNKKVGIRVTGTDMSPHWTSLPGLSKAEARSLLDAADEMLKLAKDFNTDYVSRSSALYTIYRKNFQKVNDVVGGIRTITPGNRLGYTALNSAITSMVRYQWNSVYFGQTEYVKYLVASAKALTAYVEASA